MYEKRSSPRNIIQEIYTCENIRHSVLYLFKKIHKNSTIEINFHGHTVSKHA
jgi:hypothetical protein